MTFIIKHEIRGRIRFHIKQKKMTVRQADMLQAYLSSLPQVTMVKVYERTCDAVVMFEGSRSGLMEGIKNFSYDNKDIQAFIPDHSSRELNSQYEEKLVNKVLLRVMGKLLLPASVRMVWTAVKSVRYLVKGVKSLTDGKLKVEVLDATAIAVSIARRDFNTAGSVMFLLGIGELLEEWTHKKSVADLARSMSLNVDKVWMKIEDREVSVPLSNVKEGDRILVRMGGMVPLDGVVAEGQAMINQSSMTGESVPVKKEAGAYVYAGTILEEGEILIQVKKAAGDTRFEKIVAMIEESEKLKSSLEGKAESLADALVPYCLAGTALTYLFTGNVNRALSVLMVDFSCALKLAMPIAVLSAMREANDHHITVKGGKYLEAVAKADTMVFDKTGTLTKARPKVAQVVTFGGRDEKEMLRLAACLEEHYPHSIANAVVHEAKRQNLEHEEMHSKVEYIMAHGISSVVEGKKVIIGSYHFVFEDEKAEIPGGEREKFCTLSEEYSHLYMAVDGELAAVICIQDPLRAEAREVIRELKKAGIGKIVMMTGDNERTAVAIARSVGMDEYYSEVLPEDKAEFVEREKQQGRKVIMIGDGINDSPALSAASVGIAISRGADIAREIADITILADSLKDLLTLKRLSDGLIKRVHENYQFVIGFNLGLIILGMAGILQPSVSALLHNSSTLVISLRSMTNLIS